jgi:hypothetical protein
VSNTERPSGPFFDCVDKAQNVALRKRQLQANQPCYRNHVLMETLGSVSNTGTKKLP